MNNNNNAPEVHPGEYDSIAMSLLEFNNAFIDLDSQWAQEDAEVMQAEAQSNALKLGLMAFHRPRNSQVIIKPLHGCLRQPYKLEISRDYDSLISFMDELPVNCDIYIYCMFHFTLTLKKSLHVKVRIRTEAGQVSARVHDSVMHWPTKRRPFVASSACVPPQSSKCLHRTNRSSSKHPPFFPSLYARCWGLCRPGWRPSSRHLQPWAISCCMLSCPRAGHQLVHCSETVCTESQQHVSNGDTSISWRCCLTIGSHGQA